MTTTAAPTAVSARNWIDGGWSTGGAIHESVNPSTGETVGRYVSAGRGEAETAIAAARRAFDATDWPRAAGPRARALHKLADALEARIDDLALMLSRENGKLLAQTHWEARIAVDTARYSAAAALTQISGRAGEPAPGVHFWSMPEPMGVAGIIVPWNSPIVLAVRAIGPALGAGCSAVVKMPGQTGLTNALFAEVIADADALPPGVLNILTETGDEVAPAMVASSDVNVISYTGSTRVGRAIAAAAAPTVKRLNLELGGKTPLILFPDIDIDVVVPQLVASCILMNGQFCVTGARVLVHRDIADAVRARLADALRAVRVGPSEDPATELGPLIDRASVERVDRLVEDATAYATAVVRGGPPMDPALAGGAYYRPSLLEVDDTSVPLVQEEIFGPVQTFEVFGDEREAVAKANATVYGLGASVFTRDAGRARRIGRQIASGQVWINTWALLSEHFEEPGMKHSGYGRLCGPSAINEFQNLKVYSEPEAPLFQ
jgi:betaine-aldehyde dehydrogenase